MGWTTPDGEPAQVLEIRPGQRQSLRPCRLRVPPGQGYVVGDIKNAGKTIDFGAQIADFITIKLEGLATRIGQSAVAPFQMPRRGPAACRRRWGATVGNRRAARPAAPQPECRGRRRNHWHGGRSELVAAGGGVAAEESAEKALMARLPEAAPGFEAVEADDGSAPPALLPYPKLPKEAFKTRLVSGKIMAYASPDSTYAVTKKLLDSAQRSIVIGIYDFRADYMKSTSRRP